MLQECPKEKETEDADGNVNILTAIILYIWNSSSCSDHQFCIKQLASFLLFPCHHLNPMILYNNEIIYPLKWHLKLCR